MARDLMSDEEWGFFEPFILGIRVQPGRPAFDHRKTLDGIFWIARTGSPWRDLPEEFGGWTRVYRQFRRWTIAGLWETILAALNESGRLPDRVQMVDSTIIRAHQHSAGGKRGLKKKVSAGGVTSKVHLRVDGRGLPMKAEVTGGQVSDYVGYDEVREHDELPAPKVLIADRGYDSDAIRTDIERKGGHAGDPDAEKPQGASPR